MAMRLKVAAETQEPKIYSRKKFFKNYQNCIVKKKKKKFIKIGIMSPVLLLKDT